MYFYISSLFFIRIHKKLRFFTKLFHGFTLVELIVVISVLAVLASIAMSQVSNITAWARDSQRMTDMSAMKSSIELYKAKTGKLPIPTNWSGVTYSWGLLWTQGTFGEPTWRQLNSITPKPVDPTNAIEYVYSVANNNREFELGGILEKATGYFPNILPELLAASQNVTFIEGTYNGVSLKVETGSKVYVVAAPSLIGGYLGDAKMENTGLTIEGLGSLPLGFSGVVVSTANTGTFKPAIAWSGAKLPETSTGAEALIIGLQSAYTGTVATSLSQISSLVSATGSQITALWEGLVENALGGTLENSTTNGTENTPIVLVNNCPSGFIPVPGNVTFGTADFCVMKYEAKNVGSVATSTGANTPWTNITQGNAIATCQALGAGYHLITNNEWMTIARNIELVGANWSGGSVGNGYIYSGHSDGSAGKIAASENDNDGYINTWNSSWNQKRTLLFSNGHTIWDIAGNVFEHVNKANTANGTDYNSATTWLGNACGGTDWYAFSLGDGSPVCVYQSTYSYASIWPITPGLNANHGIGRIYSNAGSSVFLRGGSYDYGASTGIYNLRLDFTDAASTHGQIGFRCAK